MSGAISIAGACTVSSAPGPAAAVGGTDSISIPAKRVRKTKKLAQLQMPTSIQSSQAAPAQIGAVSGACTERSAPGPAAAVGGTDSISIPAKRVRKTKKLAQLQMLTSTQSSQAAPAQIGAVSGTCSWTARLFLFLLVHVLDRSLTSYAALLLCMALIQCPQSCRRRLMRSRVAQSGHCLAPCRSPRWKAG